MTKSEKQKVFVVVRQILYLTLVFALILGMHIFAKQYGTSMFEENSLVENSQFILLLLSASCFFALIKKDDDFKPVLFLLSSFALFAACRELDAVLDKVVPVIHWKFAFLFPSIAVIYAFLHKKRTIKNILNFSGFPAFYMMYLAVIIIIPLAQCIGHKPFVSAVLSIQDASAIRNIKQLYEEAAETVGYFVILLSAVELFFNLRTYKK